MKAEPPVALGVLEPANLVEGVLRQRKFTGAHERMAEVKHDLVAFLVVAGKERPRPAEQGGRAGVQPEVELPAARGSELARSAPAQGVRLDVMGTKIGAMSIRLLEMVPDDLRVLARSVTGLALASSGIALVQLAPDTLGNRAVRGVTDERVLEAKGLLVCKLRLGLVDQSSRF